MLRIVLPFYSGDIDRMLELVTLMNESGVAISHSCLLAYPVNLESDPRVAEIKIKALTTFLSVSEFSYIDREAKWPEGPNAAWQAVAAHIHTIPDKKPWFWMESDVTPLTKTWANTLEKEYISGGKPFMGPVIQQMVGDQEEHMNGVAVYPWNAVDYSSNAMITREAPFDIALSNDCMIAVHPANSLIAHFPRFTGVQMSVTDKEVLSRLIATGAVLLHGCNDGSAARLLRDGSVTAFQDKPVIKYLTLDDLENGFDEGETNWQKEAVTLSKKGYKVLNWEYCQDDLPSFRDQRDWKTGVFHLPHTPNQVHLNAGVTRDDDGKMWLVSRLWERFDETKNHWRSEVQAFLLKGESRPLIDYGPITLDFGTPFQVQHEDPRVTFHDGHFWVSDCIWEKGKRQSRPRQQFSKFTKDWKLVETVRPKVGNNVAGSDKSEKNWLWFHDGNTWKFVYSFSPHTVIPITGGIGAISQEPKTWRYGEIRGGTPPVLVDGEYWSFFHSSLPWRKNQRRYYMGAYSFSAKNPHQVTRITGEPLLAGSEHDPRILRSQITVFPSGAIHEMGHWTITAGINDEQVGWVRIPHYELINMMEEV